MVAIGTLARDAVNNLACPIITFGKQLPGEDRSYFQRQMVVVSTLTPHREWLHGRMWLRSLRCSPPRISAARAQSAWRPTTPLFPTGGFPGSSGYFGIGHGHRWWCEDALGHGRGLPRRGRGCSKGSLSLDTVGRHKMHLKPRRDQAAEEMLSLSEGFLPIGCLGQTLIALDWKLKTVGWKKKKKEKIREFVISHCFHQFSIFTWFSHTHQTVYYLWVGWNSGFDLGLGQTWLGALPVLSVTLSVGERWLCGAHLVQRQLHSLVLRVPFDPNRINVRDMNKAFTIYLSRDLLARPVAKGIFHQGMTMLVQTKISQQLLDDSPWNCVQILLTPNNQPSVLWRTPKISSCTTMRSTVVALCEMPCQQVDGLPWNSAQTFKSPSGWTALIFFVVPKIFSEQIPAGLTSTPSAS